MCFHRPPPKHISTSAKSHINFAVTYRNLPKIFTPPAPPAPMVGPDPSPLAQKSFRVVARWANMRMADFNFVGGVAKPCWVSTGK